ncbi:unnamed protein product [Moneuplotes crassus]|uniref:Uncharacterized protein n=1 Tax=Euplotes crassus TaxID=5936 RepID=A0AAD1XT38_EUPCR|nr:unnamed protein product [Moneuplotes crassus]
MKNNPKFQQPCTLDNDFCVIIDPDCQEYSSLMNPEKESLKLKRKNKIHDEPSVEAIAKDTQDLKTEDIGDEPEEITVSKVSVLENPTEILENCCSCKVKQSQKEGKRDSLNTASSGNADTKSSENSLVKEIYQTILQLKDEMASFNSKMVDLTSIVQDIRSSSVESPCPPPTPSKTERERIMKFLEGSFISQGYRTPNPLSVPHPVTSKSISLDPVFTENSMEDLSERTPYASSVAQPRSPSVPLHTTPQSDKDVVKNI